MNHSRDRTVALVRRLRSIGPRRRTIRRLRILRPARPDAIARSYFDAIRWVCELARTTTHDACQEVVSQLADFRHARRLDAKKKGGVTYGIGWESAIAHEVKQGQAAIGKTAALFAKKFRPDELTDVARKFGKRTSDFQKAQLDKQVRAAMGIPLSAIEKPVRDRIEGFAATNVDLIRTVPDRYFDRLRLDVEDAFSSGKRPEELAEDFADRYDMALDDARRIARDQINKLNGEVNQDRQEALGVERFVWRTMNDERVRDSHSELEGETYSWDDPPIDDDTGEEITPGSAILCRCYAEPVLDDILEGLDI